jgi:hypothetical protein
MLLPRLMSLCHNHIAQPHGRHHHNLNCDIVHVVE